MIFIRFFMISFILFNYSVLAQEIETYQHQCSTFPSNGRYEIVQSQIAIKFTFRLDRFTGRVSQLVKDDENNISWQEIEVYNRPFIERPARPIFQIFTSGIAVRNTFLIDTDTGNTWELASAKETDTDGNTFEKWLWQPLKK